MEDEAAIFARKCGLKARLAWPLRQKVAHSEQVIREWYEQHGGMVQCHVSGKDSWAMAHLVRSLYPDVPLVYADTGMEFPEVREFNRARVDHVTHFTKPFAQVVKEEGWPVVSKTQAQYIRQGRMATGVSRSVRRTGIMPNGKRTKMCIAKCHMYLLDAPFAVSEKCCHFLKTGPLDRLLRASGRIAFVGTRIDESRDRRRAWEQHGCNNATGRHPQSHPLALWTEADVWEFICAHGIELPSIYDRGYQRTGCMLCGFGVHFDSAPNRFQMLAETHPKIWEWGMHTLGMAEVLDFMKIPWKPERRLL